MNKVEKFTRILKMSDPPILIGGCGRTGTSLMTAILDAHPHIMAHPEETNIFAAKRKYVFHSLNAAEKKWRFYRQLIKNDIKSTATRWCEKTPRNLHQLDHLFKEFGKEIQIILMLRDGRDVITSKHPKKDGYYISIERWLLDTEATFSWQHHPQVLLVPYAAVVGHFEPTLKRVFEFLREPFVDQILDFDRFSGVQSHDAFHQNTLKPVYSDSMEKWRLPEHSKQIETFLNFQGVAKWQAAIEDYQQTFINNL